MKKHGELFGYLMNIKAKRSRKETLLSGDNVFAFLESFHRKYLQ